MFALPAAMIRLLHPLESIFREQTWEHANVLLVGTMLAPAKRTVTAALSVLGLRQEMQFQPSHRVVCGALARSSDAGKKPGASGGRDAGTVIESGEIARTTPLLFGLCSLVTLLAPEGGTTHPHRRMVCKHTGADLFLYAGLHAPTALAHGPFCSMFVRRTETVAYTA